MKINSKYVAAWKTRFLSFLSQNCWKLNQKWIQVIIHPSSTDSALGPCIKVSTQCYAR